MFAYDENGAEAIIERLTLEKEERRASGCGIKGRF